MSIQLTTNYYGKLTALEYDPTLKKWKCLCKCGNYCFKSSSSLAAGRTGKPGTSNSCGCVKLGLKQQLVGKTFSRLLVLSRNEINTTKRKTYWTCVCSCGKVKSIAGGALLRGATTSCGCYNKEMHLQYKNLTGNIYNYWAVISHKKRNECICRCKCGTEKIVKIQSLTEGTSKSCGCFKRETVSTNLIRRHRDKKIALGLDPDIMLSTQREIERKRILPLLKQTKARDNYTCRLCGANGCSIASHHIEKVSENYELFEEETNLITLCVECHEKVHQNNFHGPTNPELTKILKDKIEFIYKK